ncbi:MULTISPECIES: lysophospholipid acyltransferase family protein [Marinobacter]|uniref:lysophospholipid acyltransferase family protein n=1 Tax=Marinobacter TaxID=2742 RepID=UPI001B134A60|nr:lysophospholipid acyltransferase family protein [Marinobacter sp.]MBO6812812.1 1-acyl-sn-glycerol-3-phosphate acyltransferase [Marinobacter sp.]MBO6873774.1 1-acyl-sn-glycerol-3-phosphate acyltransferase [Marinobacter sp.]MDX1559052.1 lysophospholipid acyltransferase family protein [Marinobacter sp.]
MSWLRLCVRITAFVAFLAATTMLAAGLRITEVVTRKAIDRTPWARFCFRWACRCLGLDIHQHGSPSDDTVLLVSNHISWSDIPILGSLAPIRFLSKAEVGQWPVIGWLAQQAGTLFIRRGGGQARRVRNQIIENLQAGENVLVYPEGTTSAGLTVLPFHGLLLKAAPESRTPVQPVTIAYRRNGRPDHLAPFIGDDEFHCHLLRMLREPSARVDVVFHAPVSPSDQTPTGELATRLRETVLDGLTRIYSGEYDEPATDFLRTGDDPGLPHLPSLHDGQRSPDRSTG